MIGTHFSAVTLENITMGLNDWLKYCKNIYFKTYKYETIYRNLDVRGEKTPNVWILYGCSNNIAD